MNPGRRRWFRWTVVVATLLVALAIMADLFLLPVVVRAKFRATLERLTSGPVSFRLDHVSLWASQFSDIRIGQIRVPLLAVAYEPWSVVRGRLDAIEVVGARILMDLEADSALPYQPAKNKAETSAPSTALPFQRVDLSSCLLVIRWKGREVVAPFAGHLAPATGGGSSIEAEANAFNTPIKLSGSFDAAAGAADLKGGATGLEAASILAALPQDGPLQSLHAGGKIDLQIVYQLGNHHQTLRIDTRATNGWLAARGGGRVVVARPIDLSVSATLGDQFHVLDLKTQFASTSVSLDRDLVFSGRLAAKTAPGDRLDFSVKLDNPDWKFAMSQGQVVGLMRRRGAIHLQSDCAAEGKLPQVAGNALLRQGIDVSGLGAGHLHAHIAGELDAEANGSARKWSFGAEHAMFTLDRGSLRLPNSGILLDRFSAFVPITLSASPGKLKLILEQGLNVAASQLSSRWSGPELLKPNDPKVDLADLTLLDHDAELELDVHGDAAEWSGTLPALRLRLAPTDIELSGGARISSAAAIMRISARTDAKQASVFVTNGSWFGFQSARVPRGADSIEVGGLYLQSLMPDKDPAHVTLSPAGDLQGQLELHSSTKRPFVIVSSAGRAELADLAVSAQASRARRGRLSFSSTIQFDHGLIKTQGGLGANEMSARLPVTFNHAPAEGMFAIGKIQAGKDSFAGPSGAMKWSDGCFDFSLKWPWLKESTIDAQGWADQKGVGGGWRADFQASMPKFTLADPTELASLTSALKDARIAGVFSANARISLDRGALTPLIQLEVADARLQSTQYSADIEGFSTSVKLNSFAPLSTPGNQRISIKRATLGKLEVNGGLLSFSIESPRSLLVEKSQWGWAGGQLYTDAFRVNPAANPDLNLVVYADNLSIAEVLKTVSGSDAGGAGTLYGRLPVEVHWPMIRFNTGFLYAEPGPGDLKLGAKAAARADQTLSRDPRFSSTAQGSLLRSRMVSALRDFHYDLLKVNFVNRGQDLTASLKLDGYGRIGKDKQELHLELNAAGFDQLLRNALVVKSILGR